MSKTELEYIFRVISLAANGYTDLYDLLTDQKVPIEYIKCPLSTNSRDEVNRALAYRPVVLHCWGPPGYSATRPEIPEPKLLQELSRLSDAPFVSVHLDYLPQLDGELDPLGLIARVHEMVKRLRDLTEKEILLENVPWYPWTDRPRISVDPSFIDDIVENTGAGLLLDLAHAQVAAWHQSLPVEDYVMALPLEQVREIHISGPRMSEEGLRDRHMSLRETDSAILELVLEETPNLELITSEYSGRRPNTASYNELDGPETLARDLKTLDEIRLRRNSVLVGEA